MQTILLNFVRSRRYELRDINFINIYDSKKLLRGEKQEDDIPYLIGYSKEEILNNPTEPLSPTSLSVPSSPSSLTEDLYTNAMGRNKTKRKYKTKKYKKSINCRKKYCKYGRTKKKK
jgi:hypothetical protein